MEGLLDLRKFDKILNCTIIFAKNVCESLHANLKFIQEIFPDQQVKFCV